jgi:hypothetical protein
MEGECSAKGGGWGLRGLGFTGLGLIGAAGRAR